MARTYTFTVAEVPVVVPRVSDEPNPFTDMVKELAADRAHSRTFPLWAENDVPEGTKKEDALSVDQKRNKELAAVVKLLNTAGNEHTPPVTVRKSVVQLYGTGAKKNVITDLQLKVWAVDKQQRPRKEKNGANTATPADSTTGAETATTDKAGSKA